jgi:hypothetical protein
LRGGDLKALWAAMPDEMIDRIHRLMFDKIKASKAGLKARP